MMFIVLLLPKIRFVQNKTVFLPFALGRFSMKAEVSFAGREPSTGVPMIKGSKSTRADGCVSDKANKVPSKLRLWLGLSVLCFLFLKSKLRRASWFLSVLVRLI